MIPPNRSRYRNLSLAFIVLVAGLVVWLGRSDRPTDQVEEPSGVATVEPPLPAEDSAAPSVQVEQPPGETTRTVLWSPAGPLGGEALDPTSLATKVALIQGRQPQGRSASFTVQAPGALAALQRGPAVSLKQQLSFAIFGF